MEITALKIVILGGKSSVLRLQIMFYGSTDALSLNNQMTILNTVIP